MYLTCFVFVACGTFQNRKIKNGIGVSIDRCKDYIRRAAMQLLYVVMLLLLLAYLTT